MPAERTFRPTPRWLPAALAVTPALRLLIAVHAVPPGSPWRSTCPYCDLPLAGQVRLVLPAGRCGGCGHRVGAPPYAVEAATVATVASVAVAAAGRTPAEVLAIAGWAGVALALSFIDLAVHRLPDRLTLPAAGWVLAALGVAALTGADGSWPRAALAALACGAGFALVTLVAGERAFGLGDAKLAISAGALLGWFSWSAVLVGLFLAFLGSGLVALGLLVTRRAGRGDTLPFGPYLAGGTLLTLTLTA